MQRAKRLRKGEDDDQMLPRDKTRHRNRRRSLNRVVSVRNLSVALFF